MTIWIDVEDLFYFERFGARPSGIQRLSFEVYRALMELPGQDIRFVRHDLSGDGFCITSWEAVCQLYERMANTPHGKRIVAPKSKAKPLTLGALRSAVERMPMELREPLSQAVHAQILVLKALWRSSRTVPGLIRSAMSQKVAVGDDRAILKPLADVAKPGDILCSFGSPWFRDDYGLLVEKAKREMGLQFSLMIYDLIPLMNPAFFMPDLTKEFTRFCYTCLPLADRVFVISKATAHDVEAWSDKADLTLARPVFTIPVGTGFSKDFMAVEPDKIEKSLPHGLVPGSYALFVSTIEVRKNHALAFRAWRQLLDELPPEKVPTLVLAGRVGWLVGDLMQQIENSGNLGGKLIIIEGATDAELEALYRGCRFTLFPSYYEGWGLPVTESLSFGKVCIASDRTSVPEAGGDFCLYVDPDNVTGAANLLREIIEKPNIIESLEEKIRHEFRPVSWSRAADAIIQGLTPAPAVAP